MMGGDWRGLYGHARRRDQARGLPRSVIDIPLVRKVSAIGIITPDDNAITGPETDGCMRTNLAIFPSTAEKKELPDSADQAGTAGDELFIQF